MGKVRRSQSAVSVLFFRGFTRQVLPKEHAQVSYCSTVLNPCLPDSFPQISPGEILELCFQALKPELDIQTLIHP